MHLLKGQRSGSFVVDSLFIVWGGGSLVLIFHVVLSIISSSLIIYLRNTDDLYSVACLFVCGFYYCFVSLQLDQISCLAVTE